MKLGGWRDERRMEGRREGWREEEEEDGGEERRMVDLEKSRGMREGG